MSSTDNFLLSILYFWASSTALSLGVGYYTVYRPVITGLLTGLILGQPFIGMTVGAVVNIIYIDFVSTGGSFKGDQCLTSMVAVVAAIYLKLNPIEAAAAAYPFGYVGILIWKYRLNINSVFVKKYEEKYKLGQNPNISIYDGLFPQLLLYVMSTAVILVTIFVMFFLKEFIYNIKSALFLAGIFLVFCSIWNILYKIGNKKAIYFFIGAFFITMFLKLSSYIIFIIALGTILILSNKNIADNEYKNIKKHGVINKKDLIYSWFIWMNFSHSCYSYERLQGMAYAHSMKNIFHKLYQNSNDEAKAVHKHSEFFNTEPNMGTPIHGYIISLEEELIKNKNDKDIMYIKKGMMGIAAGLGDSYTQVVLTPIFISMSVMLCLDNKFIMSLIPILILASTILFISYTGFMKGYYEGKESLIKRINIIKSSKVKLYFPHIFSGILGVSLGKLLITYNLLKNLTTFGAIGIISVVYTALKLRRSLR